MDNFYFQDVLKGNVSVNPSSIHQAKSLLEVEIDKEIDKYIEEVITEEPVENPLMTPAIRKARLRAELKEECKQTELSHYLDEAFEILEVERKNHTSDEKHQMMLEEFYKKLSSLESIAFPMDKASSFKTALSISESAEKYMVSLAEKKSAETGFASSLPLYVLLSILDPGNATYWYRAAIACHSNHDYKIAIRFYNASLSIEPELIGAKLFSADCYLECELHEEALQSLKEAEAMKETPDFEKVWRPLMTHLAYKLKK